MFRVDSRRQATDEASAPPGSSTTGRIGGALASTSSSSGKEAQSSGKANEVSRPADSTAVAVELNVARRESDGLVVVDALSASRRSQRAVTVQPEVECLCAAMAA